VTTVAGETEAMTTDPRIAALAAVLRSLNGYYETDEDVAAAILAALDADGWALVIEQVAKAEVGYTIETRYTATDASPGALEERV
jgi:hypothetical protein